MAPQLVDLAQHLRLAVVAARLDALHVARGAVARRREEARQLVEERRVVLRERQLAQRDQQRRERAHVSERLPRASKCAQASASRGDARRAPRRLQLRLAPTQQGARGRRRPRSRHAPARAPGRA
eukprot:3127818-Prymnesium_polylepis.1